MARGVGVFWVGREGGRRNGRGGRGGSGSSIDQMAAPSRVAGTGSRDF